jgi:hypothetical protein
VLSSLLVINAEIRKDTLGSNVLKTLKPEFVHIFLRQNLSYFEGIVVKGMRSFLDSDAIISSVR